MRRAVNQVVGRDGGDHARNEGDQEKDGRAKFHAPSLGRRPGWTPSGIAGLAGGVNRVAGLARL